MTDGGPAPAQHRRIIPTGVLAPPETPAPDIGKLRTTVIARVEGATDAAVMPDGLPVPPRALWRGYGDSASRYIELATRHAESMLSILGGMGAADHGRRRVLELGCAACPMLRMVGLRRPAWELWGCDIDPVAIDWSRRNLVPALNLFTNTTAPHLPLADASFDLAYAGSVFTHIEHMADAWLLELARILKPGGHLYATIHDRAFIGHTIVHAPEWRLTQSIRKHFTDEQLASDWAWLAMGTGPNANIFYDRDYFLRMASCVFECVGAAERGYGDQTALVLRRRDAA